MANTRHTAELWALLLLAGAGALAGGCTSTGVNRAAIATGMRAEATRGPMMEATLEVMDQHPEYVDEFFQRSREHGKTLDRFLSAASQQMQDPALADMAAARLVQNPAGLRTIVSHTLDHARNDRRALDGVALGLGDRSDTAAESVAPHPTVIRRLFRGLSRRAARNPTTAAALLASMRDNREVVTRLIVRDPPTRDALAGATARQAGSAVADSARDALGRFVHGDAHTAPAQPANQRGGGPR